MIDNSKEAVNGAVAVKALNTVKVYCATHLCPDCPLREDLEKYNSCPIPKLDVKSGVGFFRDITSKRTPKPPKFDATLPDSPNFRDYINGILELEADRAGISPSGLGRVKCYPNGTIKVWYTDEGGETVYKGKAKCHPNDAFNPEIGIKLAVQRIVEKLNKPFVPEENEAYYYADDENRIYSTINHNTNTDILNIAVGNCFRKRKEAHANKESIRKRIERATELLKTLRDERDE